VVEYSVGPLALAQRQTSDSLTMLSLARSVSGQSSNSSQAMIGAETRFCRWILLFCAPSSCIAAPVTVKRAPSNRQF